ncbi:MAG: SufD family Fe-S cluster assembly protein [Mycoplasmataceae bacterium]|jgi:Fe-S cluster assembly protein SufD|nr:SufD family Fe-S cluster assembly protein [Mycoplasmataceae bacterium]
MSSKIIKYTEIKSALNLSLTIDKTNDKAQIFFIDTAKNDTNINLNFHICEDVQFTIYIYTLNAGFKKNIKVKISHESKSVSNTIIKALASSNAKTQIDLVSVANKNVVNLETNQSIDGVIFDNSAQINVTPSMLIDTNVIKASHSVNIGNVNPDQLFYLMARGIDKVKATMLILDGMFGGIKRDNDKKAQDIYNNISLTLSKMVKK